MVRPISSLAARPGVCHEPCRRHSDGITSPVSISIPIAPLCSPSRVRSAGMGSTITSRRTLSFRHGRLMARMQALEVRREHGNHFTLGAPEDLDLAALDVVLMRQTHPSTWLYHGNASPGACPSEHAGLNDPVSVRNAPEKLFVTHFDELMPPTLITSNHDEILAFRANTRTSSSSRCSATARGPSSTVAGRREPQRLARNVHADVSRAVIIQRYLPDPQGRQAHHPGRWQTVRRCPACAAGRRSTCQFHAGGSALKAPLTSREMQICEAIGPILTG